MNYSLGRVPQIVAGEGSLGSLNQLLSGLKSKSVFLVADSAIAPKLEALDLGLPKTLHVIPSGEPTQTSVNAAKAEAAQLQEPCVVAVGGGSALDTGKQVAAILRGSHGIEHYFLCANPLPERTPSIAVPTTAGTGAEVTRTCIVSDTVGRKLWTWGDEMLPDAVILEPSLTVSVPDFVTAFTGLDAFVHALEAATAKRANTISSQYAKAAMSLIHHHLATAVLEPNNLVARLGMQEAALLAGIAIDNCGTGIAHNIGHALGTLYHLPHGVAVALALEAALGWNIQQAPEIYAALDFAEPDFALLLEQSRFAEVVRLQKPHNLEPENIVAVMNASENLPMLNNNVALPNPAQQLELAKRTTQRWEAYRS